MEPGDSNAHTQRLLERLDAIGASLAQSGHAIALLGLGSVGEERDRLDAYSDLDFFTIVQPGFKSAYINDLSWLAHAHPLAFTFQNTIDGHKALFDDGIYAEFAVFEPDELSHIPTHKGRVVWQVSGFDLARVSASYEPLRAPELHTTEWLVGEIITNLYVGLMRWRRGERLSAMRLIQMHAVDRLLELAPQIEQASSASADPFALERRCEARYPGFAASLPAFTQGYEHSAESALAILAYVERHAPVNATIKQRIVELGAPTPSVGG